MIQGRLTIVLPKRLPESNRNMPIPGGGACACYCTVEHPNPFMIITGDLGQQALVWLGGQNSTYPAGLYMSGNPRTLARYFTEDELTRLVKLALADLTKDL